MVGLPWYLKSDPGNMKDCSSLLTNTRVDM